jgi:hypothetical protein
MHALPRPPGALTPRICPATLYPGRAIDAQTAVTLYARRKVFGRPYSRLKNWFCLFDCLIVTQSSRSLYDGSLGKLKSVVFDQLLMSARKAYAPTISWRAERKSQAGCAG